MDVPLTTPLGHLCLKARSIQRMSTKLGFKVMRFKFTNYSDESEKSKAYWIYSLTITRPVSGLPKLARYWQIFQKWPSFFFYSIRIIVCLYYTVHLYHLDHQYLQAFNLIIALSSIKIKVISKTYSNNTSFYCTQRCLLSGANKTIAQLPWRQSLAQELAQCKHSSSDSLKVLLNSDIGT